MDSSMTSFESHSEPRKRVKPRVRVEPIVSSQKPRSVTRLAVWVLLSPLFLVVGFALSALCLGALSVAVRLLAEVLKKTAA